MKRLEQTLIDELKKLGIIHGATLVKDLDWKNVNAQPGVYRWWFPSNSPVMDVVRTHPEIDLGSIATQQFSGETYFALYFGQSDDVRQRYKMHTTMAIKWSTLRKTIATICGELQVQDILDQCYWEYLDFDTDKKGIQKLLEALCIHIGYYPLNIDGNMNVDYKWLDFLKKQRRNYTKQSKK